MSVRRNVERADCLRYIGRASDEEKPKDEAIRNAPLFSLAVKHCIDHGGAFWKTATPSTESRSDGSDRDSLGPSMERIAMFPQYGLLGFHTGTLDQIGRREPIMMNVHAPSSTFICGSQGSGKSYTLSCMLENCLREDSHIGELPRPLAGLAFHFDSEACGSVAEVAYLCSRGIEVNVLVSNSNFELAKQAYGAIPGAEGNLTVQPLLIPPSELSIERIHRLMALSEKSGSIPLYMEIIQRILREMAVAAQGAPFSYGEFLRRLQKEPLSREQTGPMQLRLNLLQSFMRWPPTAKEMKKKSAKQLFELRPGTLTVVDLSDPFVDAATVCVLFDICLGLAKEKRPTCGLTVVLDEAHKYLDKSAAAAMFTDRLLTTIREQRHNGTRVIVATQEPTLSEKLLDLCSVSIVHFFKSPAWFTAIRNHLGAASALTAADQERVTLFDEILHLLVGQSLVFAPTAMVYLNDLGKANMLGAGILKMTTRLRNGIDAGGSVLS